MLHTAVGYDFDASLMDSESSPNFFGSRTSCPGLEFGITSSGIAIDYPTTVAACPSSTSPRHRPAALLSPAAAGTASSPSHHQYTQNTPSTARSSGRPECVILFNPPPSSSHNGLGGGSETFPPILPAAAAAAAKISPTEPGPFLGLPGLLGAVGGNGLMIGLPATAFATTTHTLASATTRCVGLILTDIILKYSVIHKFFFFLFQYLNESIDRI